MLNFGPFAAFAVLQPYWRAGMASRANLKSRRSLRSVARVPAAKPSLVGSVNRIAFSRPARTAYYVLGTAGLAAPAVARIGPKRLGREVKRLLRGPHEPHGHKPPVAYKPL